MNIGRNEVSEFYFATTLGVGTTTPIVPAYSTAAADKRKRIKITDLSVTTGGTAASIRIAGQDGSYAPVRYRFPANASQHFNYTIPIPVDCVSSTIATRMIYASASDAVSVKVVITGYLELFE